MSTCNLCGGYVKSFSLNIMSICGDCSGVLPEDNGQYDAEIEFELDQIRTSGRVLPKFDNDDFGHGY